LIFIKVASLASGTRNLKRKTWMEQGEESNEEEGSDLLRIAVEGFNKTVYDGTSTL
jgi:hypothetical protein